MPKKQPGMKDSGPFSFTGYFIPNTDELTATMVPTKLTEDADGNLVIEAKAATEYDEAILQEMRFRSAYPRNPDEQE